MDKSVMNKLTYGLFVLTAFDGEKHNGCIVNTTIQVTSDPNRIALAVNKSNLTHDMIMKNRKLNISVISEDAKFDLFKRFGFTSGRDVDKFEGFTGYKKAVNDLYYVTEGTNSYISAWVEQTVDLGSHTLFIALITNLETLSNAPSASYGYYHSNIKPKPEKKPETPANQSVWRCKVCNYEYVGEELPEDYICPVCKHPASDFERIS